jgi:hypothetical protein
MIVQLSIDVKNLRGYQAGSEFAQSVAEHIKETFNDDNSIGGIYFKLLSKKKTGKKIGK